MMKKPLTTAECATLLIFVFLSAYAFLALMQLGNASEIRVPFSGPGYTIALSPTSDNATTGTWYDNDSDAILYEDIDDAPLSDAWENADDNTTMIWSDHGANATAKFGVANSTAYVGDDVTINWVSLSAHLMSINGSSCYFGTTDVGMNFPLISGTSYFIIEDVEKLYGGTWADNEWNGGLWDFQPESWYGTGTNTKWTTNPANSEPWTSTDLDSVLLVIETDYDSDTNTNCDIAISDLHVLVNISNKYAIPPASEASMAGGE